MKFACGALGGWVPADPIGTVLLNMYCCIWLSFCDLKTMASSLCPSLSVSLSPPSMCTAAPSGFKVTNFIPTRSQGALEVLPACGNPSLVLKLTKRSLPGSIVRSKMELPVTFEF